ncbi:MAG: MFS transporter [Sphingomonas sp.]|uniref:MFS transporter n=1 Tax=Sphingomonas sp. TaxID=28214 RepID=UPI0025DDBB04|nr:MFS transporter [Sphingomonas sp.]MBX3566359.1 MFS transporter [Sphingomonas sp.]
MTEAPYPRPASGWTVVILLLVAYIVAVMDRQILSLLVQPIRHDLGITDTQVSLLHGFAFVITFTVLGVFFGRVADRGNRRNLIVIGMIVWCFATVACGLARNFTELFAARMAVGVGEAALSPAAYSLIADYFAPEKRGRAMGVYTMATFMGSGVAMIAGALAILSTMGASEVAVPLLGMMPSWKAAFIVVGLPGLLVAAALAFIREPVRRERAKELAGSSTLSFARDNFRILSVMILGLACNALASFSLITWTPTVFIRLFEWPASSIGVAYGLILAGPGALGILFAGWLADRMAKVGGPGPLKLASYALAGVIPLSLWVGLAISPGISIAALIGCSFLLAMPTGLAPLAIYQITPNEHRGQLIAAYLLAATLAGLGLGPTIVAGTKDLLFGDDLKIGLALALVTTLAAIAGFALLSLASRMTAPAASK